MARKGKKFASWLPIITRLKLVTYLRLFMKISLRARNRRVVIYAEDVVEN